MKEFNQTPVLITTDLGPLWDARTDLQTLTGILGAVLYLSKPDDEDPAKEDIITALVQVQETVARCAESLHEAIKGGTVADNNKPREVKGGNGMIEDLNETETAYLDKGICPDCRGIKFLKGPHGGMSVNIMCAKCGAQFNIIPGLKGSFGKERLGRPVSPSVIPAEAGIQPAEAKVKC